ncbi:DUF4097 family beta strand repeat-containing protein [Salisediminibacterium halotolerans]|uniref:DUF4097 and DUF4098 domain-containing protein YvlB n=1 Tax=Salisediminibacterium halotolerans TaxID=517425 RepID=A0A1H9W2G5_9BACI|nr:DUF4097 domain-containing protein [Salisediminibacterium haloalkalitolerans]SES27703.1 DUF4097 and DUF4098 domain-containing protein YvlB [Salisediminibacterium haloalkalitolerans]
MSEERKMVLKMIEDGKITAEEGSQLLEALKEDSSGQVKEDISKVKDAEDAQEASQTTDKKAAGHEAKPEDGYVSKDVNWDAEGGFRRAEEKVQTFAGRFTDFIEDAIYKIKESDLDFNFGNSVEVQHIFHHSGAHVEEARVHIENGNVEFLPWDGDDIRVECNVKVYKVEDAEEARRTFLNNVVFEVSDDKVKLESKKKTMKVHTVVRVPRAKLEEVKIYAFNGKITGERVSADKAEMQTVNGRIQFDHLHADKLKLETVNGTVSVNHLDAEKADIKTVNGTVTIKSARGDTEAETLNGTIHFSLTDPTFSRAYLKTTTGSVHVAVPSRMKTEGVLKSTIGNIDCDLPRMTIIDEKRDFASKRVSFISNKNGDRQLYLEVEATTGSIYVQSEH